MFSKPTARALAILELLMANPQQAFGLTEMTRRLGLNKATCHAILSTMSNYGFLVQDPNSKGYRLGPSIVAAGHAAFAQFPVLEFARPELEKLTSEIGFGCGAMGRSQSHVVILALYGSSNPLGSPFQLGLRLPNRAPLGSCFIAWSPAKQLEAWLTRGHEAIGGYDEKRDQRFRMAVIGVRARGFEVTLNTRAEAEMVDKIIANNENWNQQALEDCLEEYQRAVSDEQYQLDRIEPEKTYNVCNISVPVFGADEQPQLNFTVGNIFRPLSGREILDIAEQLNQAAGRVTQAARNAVPALL